MTPTVPARRVRAGAVITPKAGRPDWTSTLPAEGKPMNTATRQHLQDMHEAGERHDSAEPDRLRRLRNLEPESAHLIWSILVSTNAQRVLEIGTSNGYSTIWWADAVALTGGHVTTVDVNQSWQAEASEHLAAVGLADQVTFFAEDAAHRLARLHDASVDALFLDAERTEYVSWWPHPVRIVRPGGLIFIDNAISHASELTEFVQLLDEVPELDQQLLDIGKGVQLIVRMP